MRLKRIENRKRELNLPMICQEHMPKCQLLDSQRRLLPSLAVIQNTFRVQRDTTNVDQKIENALLDQ
jgi:hypothetical protein